MFGLRGNPQARTQSSVFGYAQKRGRLPAERLTGLGLGKCREEAQELSENHQPQS
jgi:hypothetical protein